MLRPFEHRFPHNAGPQAVGTTTRNACLLLWLAAGAHAGPYDVIQRSSASAGKTMRLGTLYDALNEQSLGTLIADPSDLAGQTYEETTGSHVSKYTKDDTFSSKANLLGIGGYIAIGIDLFFASAEVQFGMNYLKSTRTSERQVRTSVKVETQTKTEFLDVFHPGINATDSPALKRATHVVTGVVWGERHIGVFQSTAASSEEKNTIGVSLQARVKLMFGIKATVFDYRVSKNFEDNAASYQETVRLYSDYPPGEYPSTRNELKDAMDNAVASLKESGRQGVPLYYILTPLASVTPGPEAKLVWDIGEDLVQEALRVMDDMEESKVAITDLADESSEGQRVWAEDVKSFQRAFNAWTAAFRSRLRGAMASARANDRSGPLTPGEPSEDVPALLKEYWDSEFTGDGVAARVLDLRAEIERYKGHLAVLRPAAVEVIESPGQLRGAASRLEADRNYLLLLVGNRPREDAVAVREFAANAASRVRPNGQPCVERVDASGEPFCHAHVAMVAAHFESYCSSLCPRKFCARESAPVGMRVCRTYGAPGDETCRLAEDAAAAEGCWPRPEPNYTNPEEEGEEVPGLGKVVTLEWCACPHTVVVELTALPPPPPKDEPKPEVPPPVKLPNPPGPPVCGRIRDDRDEADPFNQAVVWQVTHDGAAPDVPPDLRVLRYKVTISEREGGDSSRFTIVSEFFTGDASGDILVTGLQAGRGYFFQAAAINSVGAGEPSPRCPSRPYVVSSIRCAVQYLGEATELGNITAGNGTNATAEEEQDAGGPALPPRGDLPTWAVGGMAAVRVQIRASAPLPSSIAAVRFQNPSTGRTFDCENVEVTTLDHRMPDSAAMCSVAIASLMPENGAIATERQPLRVYMYDAAEEGRTSPRAMASGTATLQPPSRLNCAKFETSERVGLCEARIISVAAVSGRYNPADQAAELQILAGTYERLDTFAGWQIEARSDNAEPISQDRRAKKGLERVARVGGLQAGEVYWFFLRARYKDDPVSTPTVGMPPEGFAVAGVLPWLDVIDKEHAHDEAYLNRIPSWYGIFYAKLTLMAAPPSRMAQLRLQVRGGGEVAVVDVSKVKTKANGQQTAEARIAASHLLSGGTGEVDVEVVGASGKVVARGVLMGEEITGAACKKWEPQTGKLHCILPNNSARCVPQCNKCLDPTDKNLERGSVDSDTCIVCAKNFKFINGGCKKRKRSR